MSVLDEIEALPGLCTRREEPMSAHTTFRIGGPASLYAAPADEEELTRVVTLCRGAGEPFMILGNGSNLLCGDAGYRGVVIDTTKGLCGCEAVGEELTAQAGCLLATAARRAAAAGIAGLEFAAGIPGSVGGALIMNAGAYGGEMGNVVKSARILLPDGTVREADAAELDFSYRRSAAAENGWIVLGVTFALHRDDPAKIRERMEDLNARRRARQPLEYPSAGSTFKRPAGHYAAALIDEAHLKGLTVGGAQVSEKHAGFVINTGGATARDVLALCGEIKKRVKALSGVDLELEVALMGEFGEA